MRPFSVCPSSTSPEVLEYFPCSTAVLPKKYYGRNDIISKRR